MSRDEQKNPQPVEDGRLRVVIDTREQTPWEFPEHLVVTRRGTLDAGDYALDGDTFAIERKSLADYVATVGAQWERFQRELERMPRDAARVVIVEATVAEVVNHEYPQEMRPSYIIHRTARLTLQGVTVLFCGDHVTAAGVAYRILKARRKELEG